MMKISRVMLEVAARREPLAEGEGQVSLGLVAGRTRVLAARSRSPLRLLVPQGTGRAAWVYATGLGGGLVSGDRVSIDLELGPGGSAIFGTQGATRAYRGDRGVSQRLSARVGEGATLAVVPDPLVCFRGASASQSTRVELSPGGSAAVLDVISAGRVASGERWAFSRLDARLSLLRAGALSVDEAIFLDPEQGPVAGRMGRFDALATVVVAGEALEPHARALVEGVSAMPLSRRADLVASASPLPGGGALARIAATRADLAVAFARGLLSFLAPLLGDDPFRGKW